MIQQVCVAFSHLHHIIPLLKIGSLDLFQRVGVPFSFLSRYGHFSCKNCEQTKQTNNYDTYIIVYEKFCRNCPIHAFEFQILIDKYVEWHQRLNLCSLFFSSQFVYKYLNFKNFASKKKRCLNVCRSALVFLCALHL